MGRQSNIDISHLNNYLCSLNLSASQLKNLPMNSEAIQQASFVLFGEITKKHCYAIKKCISRNANKFVGLPDRRLNTVPQKINKNFEILNWFISERFNRKDLLSRPMWKSLFSKISEVFKIASNFRNESRIKKFLLRHVSHSSYVEVENSEKTHSKSNLSDIPSIFHGNEFNQLLVDDEPAHIQILTENNFKKIESLSNFGDSTSEFKEKVISSSFTIQEHTELEYSTSHVLFEKTNITQQNYNSYDQLQNRKEICVESMGTLFSNLSSKKYPLRNTPTTKQNVESDSKISDFSFNKCQRLSYNDKEDNSESEMNISGEICKKNISSEFEEVPEVCSLLYQDKKQCRTEIESILPLGSTNNKNQWAKRPSFLECNTFEGQFLITQAEYNEMFENDRPLAGRWTYILSKKFKYVNNVCILCIKEKRPIISKNALKIYCYCAHKTCKVFILYLKYFKNASVDHTVDVYSSSLYYNHLKAITKYVKGDARRLARNELALIKPSKAREAQIEKSCTKLIEAGNLQDIKSDSVLRKIRSEHYARNDRHDDDIWDIFLMQREHNNYIRFVGQPFCVYIFSAEQLEILSCNIGNTILHLDATGSLVRKPLSVKKRIFYYAGVIKTSFNSRLCPILEMYNCNQDTTSIGVWMAQFKSFVLKNKKHWPIFRRVITDFSFALINATMYFFNNMSLGMYLEITYKALTQNEISNFSITLVNICCAHFFKIICRDINKVTNDIEKERFLKECMAAAINLTEFDAFQLWFLYMSIVLKSEKLTSSVQIALKKLVNICLNESHNEDVESNLEFISIPQFERETEKLRENSPFFKHFKLISEEIDTEIKNDQPRDYKDILDNPYYDKSFSDLILKKYLPLLPLWSGVTIKEEVSPPRYSNAEVENWFHIVKHLIMDGKGPQKISRVVRTLRRRVLSMHKEIMLKISKDACTSKEQTKNVHYSSQLSDFCEKEEWNRKRPLTHSNFLGNELKKIRTNISYTNNGNSSKTVESNKTQTLREKCEFHLSNLNLTAETREILMRNTIDQNSIKWFEERRKRITSSNFGKICKLRTEVSKINLVKMLVYPKNILTPSMRYGNDTEPIALEYYKKLNPYMDVKRCGLVIDRCTPFLGCSPDALLNDEGILEIKCPFSLKNSNPRLVPYLDSTGNLLKSHNYFYQVQGLLHITRRSWCDFFVFTNVTSHVCRILRDDEFWKKIEGKLAEFYLCYMLPELVDPKIPICKRSWMVEPIEDTALSPGAELSTVDNAILVEENLMDFKQSLFKIDGYPIGFSMPHANKHIAGINLSKLSLETLLPGKWIDDNILNAFLLIAQDIAINNEMRLLSFETFFCEKLMLGIISDGHKKWLALNEIWTQDIWLIPIHINSNHWSLLVVVFPHKIFLYLDSLKGHPPNQLIHNLCGFIENYRDARIRKLTRWQDWTLHVPIDIPVQNVSSGNCGIHVCAWVYIIITGTAFQFSDMHMNCFRKGMAHWLLNYDLIRNVNSREYLRTALLELPVNSGKIHRNIRQSSHIPFEFSSTLEYCSSIKTLLSAMRE